MKVAILGNLVVRRASNIEDNDYLSRYQKDFLNANAKLVAKAYKVEKPKRMTGIVSVEEWEYNNAWELVKTKTKVTKEIERNVYTEHVFDDGRVLGKAEKFSW